MCADDQAMVARSQEGVQAMMDRLNTILIEYGIKMNIQIETLKICKEQETYTTVRYKCRIEYTGREYNEAKDFCYIGSMITKDTKCHREIERTTDAGQETFSSTRELNERKTKQDSRETDDKKNWHGEWSVLLQ